MLDPIATVDKLDSIRDRLRTVWAALHAKSLHSDDMVDAIASALNAAIKDLDQERDRLNREGSAA